MAPQKLSGLSAALLEGSPGQPRKGSVRPGLAWLGPVIATDGSTEGFGPLCCSLRYSQLLWKVQGLVWEPLSIFLM